MTESGPSAASAGTRAVEAATELHAMLSAIELPDPNGVPRTDALLTAARDVASTYLERLAEIYGVTSWDTANFRTAFVEGALARWRRGTLIAQTDEGVRLVAMECPLAARVAEDARVCQVCQAFQGSATRQALGSGTGVRFEQLLARGDPSCVVRFRLHSPRGRQRARERRP